MKTKFLLTLLLTCYLIPGLTLANTDPLHCPDLSNSTDIGNWRNLTPYTQPSGHDSFTEISISLLHTVGCTYNNGNLVLGKYYPADTVKPDDPDGIWRGKGQTPYCTKGPNVCFYKLT